MKVFISADIEGVTDVTVWDETELGNPEYPKAAEQMTREVSAACEAAIECGADEIYVRDAHNSARNIFPEGLPEQVKLIRGWTSTQESMMAGIDETFDAVMFIGYHSGAGFDGNPLSHTMNNQNNYFLINGKPSAEFDMNTYIAAYYGVPVVFVSGDEQLCEHAKELIPAIESCGVKKGWGPATINMHPDVAVRAIKEGAKKGLAKIAECKIESPEKFEMEISYKELGTAMRASCYPGAEKVNPRTVRFTGKDIQEMMTARMFMM